VLTGDIGMIDRNGYLYLLDRAADMIISGVQHLADGAGERHRHASVSHGVAVFGIPDKRWARPLRVVVPARQRLDGRSRPALRRAARPYKKPGRVVVRDEPLPKTPVGKIKRRELREPFWAGHTRRVAGS
jgi:acyl-CoA synthetase (AMP-forming)/AMP-acid ligase II